MSTGAQISHETATEAIVGPDSADSSAHVLQTAYPPHRRIDQWNAPPRGPGQHNMQLQARFRARSALYSQDTRRSGRDTHNDARTCCTERDLVPRQWRGQHQHAHCAQQTHPSLLSRTAGHACTLTAPRMSVQAVLRVVAVDLLRPRRLAADRAADGLQERGERLVDRRSSA